MVVTQGAIHRRSNRAHCLARRDIHATAVTGEHVETNMHPTVDGRFVDRDGAQGPLAIGAPTLAASVGMDAHFGA